VLDITTRKQTQITQTRHESSYKQDTSPHTNKTRAFIQTRHESSYKQDTSLHTNKTRAFIQTRHESSYKQLEVKRTEHGLMRTSEWTSQHGTKNVKTHKTIILKGQQAKKDEQKGPHQKTGL
jgi:hypothetical protein